MASRDFWRPLPGLARFLQSRVAGVVWSRRGDL